MRENFDTAIELIFGHEGGYVNAKTDRGGPTKYGITQRTLAGWRGHPVSSDEVKRLTLAEAREILTRQYAGPIDFDGLPAGLDYAVLDYAVNSGPGQAVKSLQRVVGVDRDGIMGMQTLAAVKARAAIEGGLPTLIRAYCDERMRFLKGLGGGQGFSANGRGWTIRVTGVDPKGQWRRQSGVIGNALKIADKAIPNERVVVDARLDETMPTSEAKANPVDTAVTSTPQGQANVGTLTGAIVGGAGTLGTALAPYLDIPWAKNMAAIAAAVGVVVVVGGAIAALIIQRRHIAHGNAL